MTLHFDSRQGLVLDQALALYLRHVEACRPPADAGLTAAERTDTVEQIRALQEELRRAHHPRRRV